ncbi:4643_t:CDS:2 [Paraglomus occultum]|uniref:4643_t:CDS:1 n=1 Tax=Paraglomus occultum TaxID=144539 RepID=A0A9N9AVY0_9GLOM|nr:4643_t:CDS:2 [Paraglomus occultum]
MSKLNNKINFIKEYWIQVFTKAIDDYARGLTPNPDVMCNREIKFGRLLEKILGSSQNDEGVWMATAVDSTKDQTYYLSTVPEEKLQRTIFPIGHLTKLQVRQIANKANLIIANKAESMGLCFVGEKNKFADFLGEYIDNTPGEIKTIDGHVIGMDSVPGRTMDLKGTKSLSARFLHFSTHPPPNVRPANHVYFHHRWFVYKKDVENNSIIVVPGSTNLLLFSRKLVARDWIWSWNEPPDGIEQGIDLLGQVRYRQVAAVAPGQYVVVWDGNWCLGGGVIEESVDESDEITQNEK